MSTMTQSDLPGVGMTPGNIRSKKLPLAMNLAVAVVAFGLAAAIVYGFGIGNWVLVVVLGWVLYLVGLLIAASRVEGRRAARNRAWRSLIYSACILAILLINSDCSRSRARFPLLDWGHRMQRAAQLPKSTAASRPRRRRWAMWMCTLRWLRPPRLWCC